jgi:hypothetical protein
LLRIVEGWYTGIGVSEDALSTFTVDLAGPVFYLLSSRNPYFIIYMAELRVDEFGMTF